MIKILLVVLALSFVAPGMAKTLPAKEIPVKKEILEKLGHSFEDVSNSEHVKRWENAARLAAEFEDDEIFDRMTLEFSKSDGGVAEGLPTHLFAVYKKNPVFYLKKELARKGSNMESIAGFLLNEVSGYAGDFKLAQAPLNRIDKKDPNFKLIEKFSQALQKVAKEKP